MPDAHGLYMCIQIFDCKQHGALEGVCIQQHINNGWVCVHNYTIMKIFITNLSIVLAVYARTTLTVHNCSVYLTSLPSSNTVYVLIEKGKAETELMNY